MMPLRIKELLLLTISAFLRNFSKRGEGGRGGGGETDIFHKNWENVGHQARDRRVF